VRFLRHAENAEPFVRRGFCEPLVQRHELSENLTRLAPVFRPVTTQTRLERNGRLPAAPSTGGRLTLYNDQQ